MDPVIMKQTFFTLNGIMREKKKKKIKSITQFNLLKENKLRNEGD